MAAEALAQVRQQRAGVAAERDDNAARALRAQHRAAHAEARLQWSPILDRRRRAGLDLTATGLAWAAGQAWREVDPEAGIAADLATERLRELRPDVMDRYDRLATDGLDPVAAMRRVAPFFDRPAARPGEHDARPALTPSLAAHSELGGQDELDTRSSASRQHFIDTGEYLHVGDTEVSAPSSAEPDHVSGATAVDVTAVDDTATVVDERLQATGRAAPQRHEANRLQRQATELHDAAGRGAQQAQTAEQPVLLVASVRTPPEVARDGYPEPLTGEVLAAGRVKPKPPDRTAPAAVRSAGLATAARASRGAR
jgi:hypothetical protein